MADGLVKLFRRDTLKRCFLLNVSNWDKFLHFYLDAFCQHAHLPESLHFSHLLFQRLLLCVQVPQEPAVFAHLPTAHWDGSSPTRKEGRGWHAIGGCFGSIQSTQPEDPTQPRCPQLWQASSSGSCNSLKPPSSKSLNYRARKLTRP